MRNEGPEKRFQRGGCSVSVFVNQATKDGQAFTIRKAVFQKSYRGSDGQWRTTQSLDANDIPKAIVCLAKAYDYLTTNGHEAPE